MSYIRTPEIRLKNSLAMKGKYLGRKMDKKTKEKIRDALKGKKRMPFSRQWRENIAKAHIGEKQTPERIEKRVSKIRGIPKTEEWKKKMRIIFTGRKRPELREKKLGSNNPAWKGGITPENKLIRGSFEYKEWRKAVFERDNYTCVWCKQRGGKLNADHIKQFCDYPELRLDINNGRTLCVPCHKKTDNYAKNKKTSDS